MEKVALPPLAAKNTKLTMFIFVLTALCCFNVVYFLSMAANPLINSDAWYFLDINIRKWISEGFDWSDLFVKRNVVDHAQPLNKLFLYINYRFFNLDFRFESLIGLIGLFSIIFFFVYRFLQNLLVNSISIRNIIAFLMAVLVITSLNATGLYTWSLVTFSFLPLAIAFACGWFTWFFLQKGNVILSLLFLLFSMLVIGDTAAIILWLSIVGSVAFIFTAKGPDFRMRAIAWLLISGVVVGAIFLTVNWEFMFADNSSAAVKISQLQLTNPNFYLETIRIIFSSSIIHGVHLTNIGSFSKVVSWLLAIPIFYFYIKHFFDLLLKKKAVIEIDFLVTFMLIYASVSIAAIIFGRVSEYGVNYLNQPRYLVIYQLIPFSLFVKWAFSENKMQGKYNKYCTLAIANALVILVIIQFFVSLSAYRSVPWVWKWHIEQTNVINRYINDPTIASGNCTPHSSPICGLPVNKRNDLLNLLQNGKLNLFNPNFQNKYRLFLDTNTIGKKTTNP